MQSSPELTELRAHPQLHAYVALLLEEGDRLGLTAFREPEPIWSELVADSATGASRLPENGRVLDLGSGGGCPGVVLQILRPDVRVWLLESNGRKASFLQRVVTELGLPSAVLNDRSETVAHQKPYRASFDMVVAKAVASLPTLIELCVPLLKVGGHLLAYKGPQAPQEVDQARTALTELSAQVEEVHAYSVGDKSYFHVLVRKTHPTHKQYPRRPGIPAKQPL